MIKTIGVIGAGVMGCGVTQNLVQSGYNVVLVDISEEILDKAKKKIKEAVRLYKLLGKEKISVETKELLEKIQFTTDYETLKNVDFIVENANEIWEIKKEIYTKIRRICKETCIFGVNTSAISITKIGSLAPERASRIIGIHFMNPVPLKDTVEVIKGYHTSDETIETTKEFLLTLHKEMVLVNDLPGFVSNRISHIFMNEAAFVVQDQVAKPEDVDKIFRKCFSHKIGPLQTADMIGLDTVVNSLDVLYQSYNDTKFRCCPLLRKMVDAGHLGMKSGEGFYIY